jgi:hypothetical protein
MHISQIRYGRNFQISEFMYENYAVEITINGNDNVDDAFAEAERIVKEQHYIKNKDNAFYTNVPPEELPITQVEKPKESQPYIATEEDIIKEMQSYKIGLNAFVAVYSDMVKGNTKLEEAYNKKLNELSK